MKFPQNAANSPQYMCISCDNLKNRAEHVLDAEILIFLLYFTENALL
jgi:hypothetical protein